jgi:hypothetical protein
MYTMGKYFLYMIIIMVLIFLSSGLLMGMVMLYSPPPTNNPYSKPRRNALYNVRKTGMQT